MRFSLLLVIVAALSGCAANSLSPAAEAVRLSNREPKDNCKYLGEVVGNQGNAITGDWTSNHNLEEGAMNDLKNKAAKRGANVLVLMTNRAGNSGSWWGQNTQSNVTMMGTAYRCPELATR